MLAVIIHHDNVFISAVIIFFKNDFINDAGITVEYIIFTPVDQLQHLIASTENDIPELYFFLVSILRIQYFLQYLVHFIVDRFAPVYWCERLCVMQVIS